MKKFTTGSIWRWSSTGRYFSAFPDHEISGKRQIFGIVPKRSSFSFRNTESQFRELRSRTYYLIKENTQKNMEQVGRNKVAFVVPDGEEPIILDTQAAGFNFTSHWITMTTTEDIRYLTRRTNSVNLQRRKKLYRELSLTLIRDGKNLGALSQRKQEALHGVFAEWSVLRKAIFGKDLPFSTNMSIVDRIQV